MLSRRKSDELVTATAADPQRPSQPAAPADRQPGGTTGPGDGSGGETTVVRQTGRLPKGYTPSKRERGLATPKRPSAHTRRQAAPLTKEQRRQRRREISEAIRRGDPEYLPARDQGPERALARDVVDSRRTVGTWFFAGALVVLLGSSAIMPPVVQVASTALWTVLALAVILDSVLLCRRVRQLVRARHPNSTARMGSLYLYTVMRSLTFRRMRIPQPRLKLGEPA